MRERTIELDINEDLFKALKYKQYDNNIALNIIAKDKHEDANLSGYSATAFFRLPSGIIIKKGCEISNNTIKIILDSDILSEKGKVDLDLTLSNDTTKITFFRINLIVEGTIYEDDVMVSDEYK